MLNTPYSLTIKVQFDGIYVLKYCSPIFVTSKNICFCAGQVKVVRALYRYDAQQVRCCHFLSSVSVTYFAVLHFSFLSGVNFVAVVKHGTVK